MSIKVPAGYIINKHFLSSSHSKRQEVRMHNRASTLSVAVQHDEVSSSSHEPRRALEPGLHPSEVMFRDVIVVRDVMDVGYSHNSELNYIWPVILRNPESLAARDLYVLEVPRW